jgi:hypothetical protein
MNHHSRKGHAMRAAALICLLAVSACSEPVQSLPPLDSGPAGAQPPAAPDSCGAAGYAVLIGQNLSAFQAQARQGPTRILRPGQAVTMDFNEQRLNVAVDANDVITGVRCG